MKSSTSRKLSAKALLLALFCSVVLASSVTLAQITYRFTTIDVPRSTLNRPHGINDVGTIVGLYNDLGGIGHGYILQNGQYLTIDVPGAIFTSARDINNAGTIVGGWVDESGVIDHGFLDIAGKITSFDVPGATSTDGFAINDLGDIVGCFIDAANVQHAFVMSGPTAKVVNVPGQDPCLTGINNARTAAGSGADPNAQYTGFVFRSGRLTAVRFPGATSTLAGGINDHGDIVGYYTDAAGITHGYVRAAGTWQTVDYPGATATLPLGLNNTDDVVGEYYDSNNVQHGFLAVPQ